MWRVIDMGAYNTLVVKSVCSSCKNSTTLKIQFKYGDTWNYHYHLNEPIKWKGNDVGVAGAKRVVLDGVAGPCELCNEINDYLVFVDNDVIVSCAANLGQFDFSTSEGYYLVLEP